jgi:Ca2+-transporting ATPase
MNIKYPIENPHTLSVEEVLGLFQTDTDKGISAIEAEKRTNEFGPNIYKAQRQKSVWYMLLRQFISPIVYLLIIAAAVSLYFRNYMEAAAITMVILVNALIGFLMEMQARSSMNALKEMDIILSKVIRDGKTLEIPSEKITLGDIVVLEAGDVIPGDGRLTESNQLQCDESSLTGESLPTEKNIEKLPEGTPLGDQVNMVFKGTSVINGKGKAVITGIAQNTQLGTITSLVEASPEKETPLDRKINSLSKKLIWIMLIMTALFALSGIIQGKNWILLLETSIALAVAAFPEGLPIVATVALAYGMLRMAKRNAIVKKLSSVETLGSTDIILTDKTGTLTENKIYVEAFSFPGEKIDVKIEDNTLKFEKGKIGKSQQNFEKLILTGVLCNNASLESASGEKKATGDPIETALLTLANASGRDAEKLKSQYRRIAEMPFSAETKIMGTLHKNADGYLVAAKGSVEHLLEKCSKIQAGETISNLDEKKKETVLSVSEEMAAKGLRVLAFAYREGNEINTDNYLNSMVYLGMVGFLDPPRLDIRDAILACRNAGIKIIMITGDHPQTALNIAKKIGLVDEVQQEVITGKDIPPLDSLTTEWKQKILTVPIFARTTPKQKYDIADVYQKAGHIVAMTGDGVNDAPALKKADIGIAMGLRGTQVAKETAGIVLKDDSFTTIADAVAHGREILMNIQKFVVYLVSCNLSEIFVVTALGFIIPAATLLPLQILFLNMVTDVFPALALGVGKGDAMVMEQPPRDPKKEIITNKKGIAIAIYAGAMTLAVILTVLYCRQTIPADVRAANNAAFITLAFAQLFHVFNMSSFRSGLLVNEVTKNKFVLLAVLFCIGLMVLVFVLPQMRLVLGLMVLPDKVWIASILFALLPLIMVQAYKIIWKAKCEGQLTSQLQKN